MFLPEPSRFIEVGCEPYRKAVTGASVRLRISGLAESAYMGYRPEEFRKQERLKNGSAWLPADGSAKGSATQKTRLQAKEKRSYDNQ
jgi:hypothetical protein